VKERAKQKIGMLICKFWEIFDCVSENACEKKLLLLPAMLLLLPLLLFLL
jgi:hypothetical protein